MQILLWIYAGWTLALSALNFILCGWDKRQAIKGRWRVPEKRLHLIELLGGWPGSWLAQRLFRHKTVKRRYRLIFGLIVLVHLSAWAGLLTWWLSHPE